MPKTQTDNKSSFTLNIFAFVPASFVFVFILYFLFLSILIKFEKYNTISLIQPAAAKQERKTCSLNMRNMVTIIISVCCSALNKYKFIMCRYIQWRVCVRNKSQSVMVLVTWNYLCSQPYHLSSAFLLCFTMLFAMHSHTDTFWIYEFYCPVINSH